MPECFKINMKESNYTKLLYLLSLFSLFCGLPINNNWFFGYEVTFLSGPELKMNPHREYLFPYESFVAWLSLLVSHILILAFPFIYMRIKHFNVWLVIIPIIFAAGQFYHTGPFLFAFTPFL